MQKNNLRGTLQSAWLSAGNSWWRSPCCCRIQAGRLLQNTEAQLAEFAVTAPMFPFLILLNFM